MNMPSVFDPKAHQDMLDRLDNLTSDTVPQWGKMNAPQMLAHLNVAYAFTFGDIEVKYNALTRFMLKTFVKKQVVGPKPYPKNGRTAPAFVISDERDFKAEKAKLIDYMTRVHEAGASAFEGRKSPSFGKMTTNEWSVQFWKHMDHHFRQFGV